MDAEARARPALTIGYSILAFRDLCFEPSPVAGHVETLVAVQGEGSVAVPEGVRVLEVPGLGVARSRNAVLSAASGEFLAFGDDDIAWRAEGLSAAMGYLSSHPEISAVLTQSVDGTGRLRKRYPRKIVRLNAWNSAKAATFEIVVRTDDVRRSGVIFDTRFGAGTPQFLGDEYAFLVDLLRSGYRGVFLPVTVAVHEDVSSGMNTATPAIAARAAIMHRVHGRVAPLVRAIFAVRPRAPFSSFKDRIRFIFRPPQV